MDAGLLPHRLDIYAPGTGGTWTLARSGVPGRFEAVSVGKRVWLQSVSKKPLMVLWLDLSARETMADGRRIFWQEGGSWWRVRGVPEVFAGTRGGHIEALLCAETADGLFAESEVVTPTTPPTVP